MTKNFTKSEQGTKAAWKGFSSQTSYIAYRLMILEDESVFYPEKAEDLMVKKDNVVQELVQVKNLSANLALSHLSPQEPDSFFQRCLAHRSENEDLHLMVVSFGAVGEELLSFTDSDEKSVAILRKKLLEYNYEIDQVDWLLEHLNIVKVDEQHILNKIHTCLESRFETMAAPSVAFDVLISYISNLSRNNGYTSKEIWEQKLDELAMDLSNMSGLVKQYGQTLFPIYHYRDETDSVSIKEEFRLGVNARPQHIRYNLDVERPYWQGKIEDGFNEKSIVLIRGASGQGKSTLAYRYLLDNYPERDIICVEKIQSQENAIEINSALNGLAKSRGVPPVVYMDVTPYDSNWIWLCEQQYKSGNDIKVLVTIREEDFRRTTVDYTRVTFSEIELMLSKEEAQDIYDRYETVSFLSFEDAWKSFGEQGPLMEFVYLLNQSDTLRNKLKAQIDTIVLQEPNSDDWLNALAIICYAGKNSIRICLPKLFSTIECHQKMKMLKVFEKEYFIRQSPDGQYIDCLHALRATILSELLSRVGLLSEDQVLISTLSSINHNALMMVVEYAYQTRLNDDLVKRVAEISYDTWQLYAGVLQAMLWADVYSFYQLNRDNIIEGNKALNGTFVMIGLNDVTGYLKGIDISSFLELINKDNPERYNKICKDISNMKSRHLDYHYTDLFLQCSYNHLPSIVRIDDDELSPCGFSLFWMTQRQCTIDPPDKVELPSINSNNQEEYLNFLVGIQFQEWWELFDNLRLAVEEYLVRKHYIVYLNSDGDELQAIAVNSMFSPGYEANNKYRTMEIVDSLRKLFVNKSKYNVEMIGQDILDGIKLPDMAKHIPADNLPFTWVTQLNRWLSKLDEYDNLPDTWPQAMDTVLVTRNSIIEANNRIINGLDFLYKNGNAKILTSKETIHAISLAMVRTNDHKFQLPKCAVDPYGIRVDNSVVVKDTSSFSLGDRPQTNNEFGISFNRYCSSMYNYYSRFAMPDNLLSQKLNRKKPTEESRLSLINLVQALETVDEMQSKFAPYSMVKTDQAVNPSRERTQVVLLTALWDHLYRNPFFKSRSLSYLCKERMKAFNKKLSGLFEKDLSTMSGVVKYTRINDTIYITVDVQQLEVICRNLFTKFKQLFPGVQTLSFEGYLFKQYLAKIIVSFTILERDINGGYSINANSFVIYDDVEKFMQYLSPSGESEKRQEENIVTAAAGALANVQALPTIFKHSTQVNQRLVNLPEDYLQQEVYATWKEDVRNYALIPTLDAINRSITYSTEYIPPQNNCSEIMTVQNACKDMLGIIDGDSDDILANKDIGELQEIVNMLNQVLTKYLGFIDLNVTE